MISFIQDGCACETSSGRFVKLDIKYGELLCYCNLKRSIFQVRNKWLNVLGGSESAECIVGSLSRNVSGQVWMLRIEVLFGLGK